MTPPLIQCLAFNLHGSKLVLRTAIMSLTLVACSLSNALAHNGQAQSTSDTGSPATETGPGKPNILFVFADDQSYETIAALGNNEIKTPSLDRLCRSGITFSHAFNMGSWSGAVCVASRTMLNSGRFVWRANDIHAKSEQERNEGRWWSSMMKSAGYRTYFTGKWHCRADAAKSFDVARNVRGGMPKQTPEGYNRPAEDGTDTWSPYDPKFGGFWEGGKHWSEVVADDAVDFLKLAAEEQDPFFMYVAFNAPHDPRQSPKEYVDMYPVDNISTPKNFLPIYPYCEEMDCGKNLRDEKLATFPRTEYGIKVNRQEYYAIISHMDAQIARILDQLKASGKADNTWIFFTADHGLACGHHGLMGKQNMYDHSLRVPFIVLSPSDTQQLVASKKRESNSDTEKEIRKNSEPIYLQDVMATALDLAGVEKPEFVEFQSLLAVLKGEPSAYEFIYGAYLKGQRAIRSRDHKLIVYPKANKVRLYDLNMDPEEMHDIADEPSSRALVKELFQQLLLLQDQMGDSLDLSESFPELAGLEKSATN